MALTIPNLEELHGFVIGVVRALLPNEDWSRYAPGWKFLRGVSVVGGEILAHQVATRRDLMPHTASEAWILEWGEKVLKMPRKAATSARRTDALRITGTPGAAVAVDAELTHEATGLRYRIEEVETIPVGGTYADVSLASIDTGAKTQLAKGEVLRFTSPPAGISEEATLVLDLDEGGTDIESIGAYRARFLARWYEPPGVGSQSDFVAWSLEVTGVDSAYAYPNRAGKGSVDVAALHEGTGAARLLGSGERAALLAYLKTKAPAHVALRVLEVQAQPVDVEITYVPFAGAGYDAEWSDNPAPTVTAWDAALRKLSLSVRPDSLEAGDHIILADISVPALDDGRQYVVEALSGTLDVILEEAPIYTPAAGDVVYAGGPLSDAIRAAVIAHLNELGPSNSDLAEWGAWEANLRPSNLFRVAQSVAGVRRTDVLDPVDIVEPPDNLWPNDAIVYLLTPGRILVRRGT